VSTAPAARAGAPETSASSLSPKTPESGAARKAEADADANSPTAMLALYLCGGGKNDKKLFC